MHYESEVKASSQTCMYAQINTVFLVMVLGVIWKNRVKSNKRVKEGIRADVAK